MTNESFLLNEMDDRWKNICLFRINNKKVKSLFSIIEYKNKNWILFKDEKKKRREEFSSEEENSPFHQIFFFSFVFVPLESVSHSLQPLSNPNYIFVCAATDLTILVVIRRDWRLGRVDDRWTIHNYFV